MAPLLPEHLVTWGERPSLQKVIAACRLAERLGARVVGLAGFTSIVGNEGEEVSRRVQVSVTSGNTLTAALALQGIRKAAELMEIDLHRATVAVIGATGDIGSICTRILAGEVGHLNLAARREAKVLELASEIEQRSGTCPVTVMKYVADAVRNADVILTATSSITTVIEAGDLKPGSVVCDVALPHNVGLGVARQRDDVLIFEGGLARFPSPISEGDWRWRYVIPDGVTLFGCLAETIVLALEQRWENFSIGRGRITPERIREIESLAEKHGFELAEFRYGGVVFRKPQIKLILSNALASKRRMVLYESVASWRD